MRATTVPIHPQVASEDAIASFSPLFSILLYESYTAAQLQVSKKCYAKPFNLRDHSI